MTVKDRDCEYVNWSELFQHKLCDQGHEL